LKTEIEISKLQSVKELTELISVFEEVFEMKKQPHADKIHLQKLLDKDSFFAIIAKAENKIVGGLTVYILDQYYSNKPVGYIYDLAVLPKYQRKGVGRSLIDFTARYCKEQGFEEMFVQVHKADGHAIEFYRSTDPANEEQAVQFNYFTGRDKDPKT
jgi:aminoglycoside 3-N-acetyltransferase I